MTEAALPMASRTLMIVAKAIQNLANQVEFGANYKVNALTSIFLYDNLAPV